jgi:membrane protease YdiL (CAAX protease family)
MKRYRLSPSAAILFGAMVTVAAMIWFSSWWMVCPGLAFTAMLVLGSGEVLERMGRLAAAVPVVLWLLYVIYAVGTGIATATAVVTMALYLAVPFIVLGLWPKAEPLVILWIWLPLELGIIREILVRRAAGVDPHYVFAQLLAIDAGIVAFIVWNRTRGVGYRFEWDRNILVNGLMNFFLFAAIGIPLGLAIHFIRYAFAMQKLYAAAPIFAGIFLFTALPEEFLFRGLIQNWIQRVSGKPGASLIAASVIFGASHLNNGPPIPNYRYFLMATIAGLFYGRAWRHTGSLMASSLTHALVDTVWTVVFR